MITKQDDIDLTDVHFFAKGDIHSLFKRMRAEDPVHWTEGLLRHKFWSLFKHEDAYTIYRGATEIFANRPTVGLPSSVDMETGSSSGQSGSNKMLVSSDGEFHKGLRKAFSPLFLPRAIKQFETSGRRLVTEILDEILPRGRCEFVTEVATRLPMVIICEMMKIPRADWGLMYDLVNQAMGAEDPEYKVGSSAAATRNNAWAQAISHLTELALERRGGDGADLLSLIANAQVMGRLLERDEVGYNAFMFVIGGLDTTRNAITGAMLEFIRDPAQLRRLRDIPSLMPTAVEEILRWTSPITHSRRTAVRDTEIRGRKIRKGDWVVVWNASANRDEEVYSDPDRFDVARTPNEHFAFAYGEHFCIGAHLARLEIRLIFEDIMARMPDMELDGEVERLASNVLAGIKRMPIRFTPRRAAAA
jgi:cytochrome P450